MSHPEASLLVASLVTEEHDRKDCVVVIHSPNHGEGISVQVAVVGEIMAERMRRVVMANQLQSKALCLVPQRNFPPAHLGLLVNCRVFIETVHIFKHFLFGLKYSQLTEITDSLYYCMIHVLNNIVHCIVASNTNQR